MDEDEKEEWEVEATLRNNRATTRDNKIYDIIQTITNKLNFIIYMMHIAYTLHTF